MDYLRQLSILDPKNIIFPITVIGCGGIGSHAALMLAKLGCPNLILIDPDTIESHNLPNQFFPLGSEGQYKVDVLAKEIKRYSDCSVKTYQEKFHQSCFEPGIIISGVDSMQSRQEIWGIIKANFVDIPFYMDARLGGELVQLYSIEPTSLDDIEVYEGKCLFPDNQSAPLPCTAREIIYAGDEICGKIGAQLKKWLNGENYYRKISCDLKTSTILTQYPKYVKGDN